MLKVMFGKQKDIHLQTQMYWITHGVDPTPTLTNLCGDSGIMRIERDIKLDYKDVLLRPKAKYNGKSLKKLT